MKKIKLISIVLAALVVVGSCIKEEHYNNAYFEQNDKKEIISIAKARNFFENYTSILKTKSAEYTENPDSARLIAGDYKAVWEKAVVSQEDSLGCVDIPINAKYKYCHYVDEQQGDSVVSFCIKAFTKMIVVKKMDKEKMIPYMITLLPSLNFARNYNPKDGDIAENFINLGNKGNFSGTVMYTIPETGTLAMVCKFYNGVYEDGVFLFDTLTPFKSNVAKAEEMLKDIDLYRIEKPTNITTKSREKETEDEEESENRVLNEVVVTAIGKKISIPWIYLWDYYFPPYIPSIPTNNGEGGGGGGGGSRGNKKSSEKKEYTISLKATYGGSVQGAGTYPAGKIVQISAFTSIPGPSVLAPKELTYYDFGGWIENDVCVSTHKSFSFTVNANRCLTAIFFNTKSDCARLFNNYKDNPNLQKHITDLYKKIISGTKIEHGYTRTTAGHEGYFTGNNNSVIIDYSHPGEYEYFMHNHPGNSKAFSPADLYAMYDLLNRNKTIGKGFKNLIQTKYGVISYEIDDIKYFRRFIEKYILKDGKFDKQHARDNLKDLTGNYWDNEYFDTFVYVMSLISGLKIAVLDRFPSTFAPDARTIGGFDFTEWKYVNGTDVNGKITYEDCIKIK